MSKKLPVAVLLIPGFIALVIILGSFFFAFQGNDEALRKTSQWEIVATATYEPKSGQQSLGVIGPGRYRATVHGRTRQYFKDTDEYYRWISADGRMREKAWYLPCNPKPVAESLLPCETYPYGGAALVIDREPLYVGSSGEFILSKPADVRMDVNILQHPSRYRRSSGSLTFILERKKSNNE